MMTQPACFKRECAGPIRRYGAFALSWLLLTIASFGADGLAWRVQDGRVDAQIEQWALTRVLERIAASSGWEIYLEPGTEQSVSARFRNLRVADALKHLLANVNYALLPQTNANAKLYVYHTSLSEAVQQIVPPPVRGRGKSSHRLGNELVVVRKPGADEPIEELARRLGAKIVGRIDGLDAYRLRFENEKSARAAEDVLRDDDDVAVDYNYVIERPTRTDSLTFSSGPSFKLRPRTDDARLVIGLIDTAVQAQGTGMQDFLLPALTVAGEPAVPANRLTHGTSMYETIMQGIASVQDDTSVRVLPVDVYGKNPNTSSFDVAAGIYTAINEGADIINLSMGGEGDSTLLHSIIQQGDKQGIVFVGAAGNEPTTHPTYPAAYPEVIAVTAGDRRGTIASYANRGNFVDVIGPGTSVVKYRNQAYLVSGTSAATAFISGVAAGMASDTGRSPAEIEMKLRETQALKPAP